MRIRQRAKKLSARRKRQASLAKLKQRYISIATKEEKEKILTKVKKIVPWISEQEFLASIKTNEISS